MIGEIEANWVLSSDLASRIDAEYYQQLYIEAQSRLITVHCVPFHTLWKDSYRIYMGIKGYEEVADNDGYTPYLRPVNIDDFGFINLEQLGWCEAGWLKDYGEQGTAKPNDLIVEVKGNTRKVAVLPARVPENCIVSGSAWRIQINNKADTRFIQAYLLSEIGQILKRREISNSIIPWINPEAFKHLSIPLPDFKIQAYIGDKVRLAEKCREEAEIIKRSAKVLLEEILNLPSIDQLPQLQTNWWVDPEYAYPERLDPNYYQPKFLRTEEILSPKSTKFSEIVVNAKYGASVPADYKEEGIPFIRGTDLSPNRIDLTDLHYLDSSLAPKVKSAKVKTGDVLLTRSGTVGVAAAINERLDNFAFGSFMIKLRFKESISPVYAAAFLNSPYGITQIERQKNGAVQQNINLEEIDRLMLPLLTIDQQQKISYLWAKWNLYLDYSQRLIYHALSDIEKLIEGEMEIEEILIGKKESLSWDDIGEEINGQLINYA